MIRKEAAGRFCRASSMNVHTVNTAIVGGTGFYDPAILKDVKEISVNTIYGEARLTVGKYKGSDIAFMARHGSRHQLPPHRINYRANISALKELGVKRILATTAVGSLKKEISRGLLVITDQFIDFTRNREHTFYDGETEGVVHTDFTEPYCPQLRGALKNVLSEKGAFVDGATYLCTEGPRYETPAEIRAFSLWGADIVGMTNVPEVTLAREAGICYANLSLVTNYAAGISAQPLTHEEVIEEMKEKIGLIREIFMETILSLPFDRNCRCWYNEGSIAAGD